MTRRARPRTVALLAVVLVALFLPAARAVAVGGVPTVTVNPNSGLVDGQPVSVVLTDFLPGDTTVGIGECPATATIAQECDSNTVVTALEDHCGAASFNYSVRRVIFTDQLGRVDCAKTACVIAAGNNTSGPFRASAPIGFVDTAPPPAPFTIALEGPHFLQDLRPILDHSGAVTIGARLECNSSGPVIVRAQVQQNGHVNQNFTYYQCEPGIDIHFFSDFIYTTPEFVPGAAQALVEARRDPDVDGQVATVTLQSEADTTAALRAALAGPNGDAVRAKLIADLNWRIAYNPTFQYVWNRAISVV